MTRLPRRDSDDSPHPRTGLDLDGRASALAPEQREFACALGRILAERWATSGRGATDPVTPPDR